MNSISLVPVIVVELTGAAANIVFACLATLYAWKLTRLKPDNFLWSYLFYVTAITSAFAMARGVGHLARVMLDIMGNEVFWFKIAPLAGGFNSLFMVAVAAVMLFYRKGVQSYDAIEAEAARLKRSEQALTATTRQLEELNNNLADMVETRAAELLASEQRFRRLVRDSNNIIFFSGPNGELQEMNPAGHQKLQFDAHEVLSLHLQDIFPPAELDKLLACLKQSGYLHDHETVLRQKDGVFISVVLSSTALYNPQGEFLGTENIAKDITQLKTMMAQLVASEKMVTVGQMAAGIAHEINTPLGVILGYAQLMMDDFPKDSETYRNLEAIERQIKASRKIVADLLKYSRHSGNVRQPVNLNEVVEDVLTITMHILVASHVTLQKELDQNLPLITGDAEQLRQVVVNLINNGNHAMESLGGGDLMMRTFTKDEGSRVCLEVQDSGVGIPEHARPHVFDPFFTTKPVGKGTGLGLSVSYGIVLEHEGSIIFESPAPSPLQPADAPAGPGTLFRLEFPVRQPEKSTQSS